MAEKVKLVAESIKEWEFQTKEELNEGVFDSPKQLLQRFVKTPEKKKLFVSAFARQLGKDSTPKGLKDFLLNLDKEDQIKLATSALKALENPKMGYPWLKISNGKIKGVGALGTKRKKAIHKETGVD